LARRRIHVIITAWNALIARIVPGGKLPVTATSGCGWGNRLVRQRLDTENVTRIQFTALLSDEVKMAARAADLIREEAMVSR